MYLVCFFFFKQKTAYEMRISDWSSDVCSSDLPAPAADPARIAGRAAPQAGGRKTIVTAKWWDAKGPRTIELGAKGQAELTGGLLFLFFGLVIAATVAAFVEPLIFFFGASVRLPVGGSLPGPIGLGTTHTWRAAKGKN